MRTMQDEPVPCNSAVRTHGRTRTATLMLSLVGGMARTAPQCGVPLAFAHGQQVRLATRAPPYHCRQTAKGLNTKKNKEEEEV